MKKNGRMAILNAVNARDIIPAIVMEAAANARVVDGVMTIPYGLWPVEIVNEKGQREKVVQRLDKTVASRLVHAFNSLHGRFARWVSGSPIYMGHPDHNGAHNAAAWRRLGKIVSMTATDDALAVKGDFDDESKTLLAANAALAPSPHWGLKRTTETHEGAAICEPVAFYSMGITARPNIAGAAVNEDPADPATAELMTQARHDQQMAVLAADMADTEMECERLRAALEVARADAGSQATQIAALQGTLAEKDLRLAALAADLAALRAELDACRAALEQSKAEALSSANAVSGQIAALIDAAGIVPADREHWATRLRETPAAVNSLLETVRSIKTGSIVTPERMAAANEALGGVTAAARFEQLVRERMAATREDWPTAWNACRVAHRELFALMPNGGRA